MRIVEFLKKDFKIFYRKKTVFVLPIVFSFVSAIAISFFVQRASYELMWIVFLFASVYPQIEIMRSEFEDDVIESLITSPVSSGDIFISKFLFGFIFLSIVGFFTIIFFVFFTNLQVSTSLLFSFAISLVGIVSLSTLFSLFAVSEDISFPAYYVIVFPFYIPVIISSVKFVEGDSFALRLILGFDIINFFASYALFDIRKLQ